MEPAVPRAIVCLFSAFLACNSSSNIQPAPEHADQEAHLVMASLSKAITLGKQGDTSSALGNWQEGYTVFERRLEHALRTLHGTEETLEMEYLLGQLRRQLSTPKAQPELTLKRFEEVFNNGLSDLQPQEPTQVRIAAN